MRIFTVLGVIALAAAITTGFAEAADSLYLNMLSPLHVGDLGTLKAQRCERVRIGATGEVVRCWGVTSTSHIDLKGSDGAHCRMYYNGRQTEYSTQWSGNTRGRCRILKVNGNTWNVEQTVTS